MIRNVAEAELFGFDLENLAGGTLAKEVPKNRGLIKAAIILIVLVSSMLLVPREGSGESSFTSENLISLLNQERIRNGLAVLETSPWLEKAAYAKAQDMLQRGYFAHTAPNGTKPWDFVKSAGVEYAFAGENLAINYTNADELNHDFMQSPTHRDNLLSPLFSEIGIAIVRGTYQDQNAVMIVEMFAKTH